VNLVVLDVLKREGVEIPFPQRVLHTAAARAPADGAASVDRGG
jgi:small-conductance mechanosensitive channel